MKKILCSILLLLILCVPPLKAEIETITIKWIAAGCQARCVQDLATRFLQMPGTAGLLINQGQGQAVIRWKPYAPFSFDLVNSAMRMAGPRINDIRIKVRGTISHSAAGIILTSLGDNTDFILLNPLRANLDQYNQQYNIQSHILTPELTKQFLEAERDSVVVEIDGPLFEPTRLIGSLYLIVERSTFARLGPGSITPGQPAIVPRPY